MLNYTVAFAAVVSRKSRPQPLPIPALQTAENLSCDDFKELAMTSREHFEHTATSLAELNRQELTRRIKNFHGRFKFDFTDNYLNNLTVDRLRHILLAALINAGPRG